jgi:uncharacterized coiled-coil protein SlyX
MMQLQRRLVIYFVMLLALAPGFVHAQTIGNFTIGDGTVIGGAVAEGDVAKNLKVLPPWTMRKCPKDFFATYDLPGAKELKLKDNACELWRVRQIELGAKTAAQDAAIQTFKAVVAQDEAIQAANEKRIAELVKQVKDEIAEKNKYKYQPNRTWLYVAVGSAVAVAGLSFGIGVLAAK